MNRIKEVYAKISVIGYIRTGRSIKLGREDNIPDESGYAEGNT